MIFIFCFSICLLGFFIYISSSKIVTYRAEKETLNLSKQISEQLVDSINKDINTLKSISQMIQTSTNINDAFVEQLKVLKQFESIFIVNGNGKISNIAPYNYNLIGFNVVNSDYLNYVIKEKKSYVSAPQKVFSEKKVVVIAVPIFLDIGGNKWVYDGIICATISLENLFKNLNEMTLEKSGNAMILDDHGFLLNNPKNKSLYLKEKIESSKNNIELNKIKNLIQKNSSGVSKYTSNNIEYVVGFHKINIQNWSILVSIPINEVLVDIYDLRKNTIILTSSFLAFTIFFTMIIKYWAQKLHTSVEDNLNTLRNIKAKLVNSSKMSALGEMAGGIAHEINTPLGVITLRASQAKKILDKDPSQVDTIKNYMNIIENVAQRIAKIVQGLRGFSRAGDNDKFQLTSIGYIIDNTLILCSERLKQREITLINEIEDNSISFECKSVQISQVLLNLINNASDAIVNEKEKWIKINAKLIDRKVEISVTNSGPKIPPSIQEKLMQPFFTTKEIGQGTGLGLSLSKGIVEGHGGELYLDTSWENTKFVFEIPLKQKIHSN